VSTVDVESPIFDFWVFVFSHLGLCVVSGHVGCAVVGGIGVWCGFGCIGGKCGVGNGCVGAVVRRWGEGEVGVESGPMDICTS